MADVRDPQDWLDAARPYGFVRYRAWVPTIGEVEVRFYRADGSTHHITLPDVVSESAYDTSKHIADELARVLGPPVPPHEAPPAWTVIA